MSLGLLLACTAPWGAAATRQTPEIPGTPETPATKDTQYLMDRVGSGLFAYELGVQGSPGVYH